MADSTTATLGMTLPETFPGDVWGNKLNANFTAIDNFAKSKNTEAAKRFDSVLALLADTSLTYTAGSVSSVTTGALIETRAEGFAYQVAASGASDHHGTTAGGVKLYVLPGPNGVISPLQFGAVGDGVTDDSSAVSSWLAYCRDQDAEGKVSGVGVTLGASVSVDVNGTAPGDHIAIRGGGENVTALRVNNATGGIVFNSTGAGRQHSISVKDMRFEPTLSNSGYPFRVVGNPGGVSTQNGAIIENVYCGVLDESGNTISFGDGVSVTGTYRPRINNLRMAQSAVIGAPNKFSVGLDISDCYFPVVNDLWINVVSGGADIGIKCHGTDEEAAFFGNCVVNGADEGLSFERTGREPHFQWIGGHINSREVGMRLNGVKYGVVYSALMYSDNVPVGVNHVDFLLEDVDGMVFRDCQFRMAGNDKRHFWLEPKAGKVGAVVRNVSIYLDQADLFATTTVAPIYCNGATNVTIYLPDEVSAADFAAYPERLVEFGPSQDPAEVKIVLQSGLMKFDSGAAAGPDFRLFRDSLSPAASDFLGRVLFDGRNTADELTTYASITGNILAATDGAEGGFLDIRALDAGLDRQLARFIRPAVSGATGMSLLVRDGSTYTLQPVTVGATDSGGTGFRVLRVPN